MKTGVLPAAALVACLAAVVPLASLAHEAPAAKPRAGTPMHSQQDLVEHFRTMQAQMDRIRLTRDPAEREKLMAEHGRSMQEGMRMMRGGGMGGGRTSMTEGRLDMMQLMMEQMLLHQQMMQPR